MKKKLKLSLFSALLTVLLFSCAGSREFLIQSTGSADFEQLDTAIANWQAWRISGKSVFYKEAEKLLHSAKKKAAVNKNFNSGRLALEGLLVLEKNPEKSRQLYIESASLSAGNEASMLLKAALASKNNEAVQILEQALQGPGSRGAVKLALAELYSRTDLLKAKMYYDEALLSAPAFLSEIIIGRKAAVENSGSRVQLTFEEFVKKLAESRPGAAALNPAGRKKTMDIIRELQKSSAGLAGLKPAAGLKKKDAALILLHVIAVLEEDPLLKTKYSGFFLKLSGSEKNVELSRLFIKDIKPEDSFFDAALITVKEAYMELEDGRNFNAELPFTAGMMNSALKLLKANYP
jgi:hypothetical protein